MCPKLVAYEYVPPGFEMVIDSTDVETGKIWNLWWNVKLTDDPETWDSEIKAINRLQSGRARLEPKKTMKKRSLMQTWASLRS